MQLDKLLDRGLHDMGLALAPAMREKLLRYLSLLEKWNKTYNLTAVRDPEQMVPRHLLDSLSVLPYVQGPRLLDIGSGAGLPGIPIAIARPEIAVTLLDSNAKKTRFITHVAHDLSLENAAIAEARIEKFHPPEKFDTLIARAFASIPDMLASCRHLLSPPSRFLIMKGVFPQEELAAVTHEYQVDVKALRIPGLDAARHLVILTQG